MANAKRTTENLLRGFMEEDRAIRDAERAATIKAMPRIRFFCGRDWCHGPDTFHLGVWWGKDANAGEGELVYQHWLTLRWRFRIWWSRQ
ncbi:MAG: hypothetical protein C5B60_09930 [Chloroflexi bacterium]|nr:MAG: hypothetical protein C5B60_09930 [Chloroflexota bacterium]